MRRTLKNAVTGVLSVLLVLVCRPGYTRDEPSAEHVYTSSARYGEIYCVAQCLGGGYLLIGSEGGLCSLPVRPEETVRDIPLPGQGGDVRCLAVRGDDVFAVSRGKLYRARFPGKSIPERPPEWKAVEGINGIKDMCLVEGKNYGTKVCVRTLDGIYLSGGHGWERIRVSPADKDMKGPEPCGDMFMVSSGDEVSLFDSAGEIKRRAVLLADVGSEEFPEEGSGEDPRDGITSLDAGDGNGVAAAADGSVFVLDPDGSVMDRVSASGLGAYGTVYAAQVKGRIFAATGREVFAYLEGESWQRVSGVHAPEGISRLVWCPGTAGGKSEGRLLIIAGRHIYAVTDGADPRSSSCGVNSRNGREGLSVLEVQRMAIKYAEVSPEKIERWRRLASWKAVLPRVSFSFSESTDDNIEIYKSSSMAYVVNGPEEKGKDWRVDLTWDLSDLVWNDAQTSIDVRSKLMVQLREDILAEVTRLYFERKRLLSELGGRSYGKGMDIEKKRSRVEEVTAYLDAFTGGAFTAHVNDR